MAVVPCSSWGWLLIPAPSFAENRPGCDFPPWHRRSCSLDGLRRARGARAGAPPQHHGPGDTRGLQWSSPIKKEVREFLAEAEQPGQPLSPGSDPTGITGIKIKPHLRGGEAQEHLPADKSLQQQSPELCQVLFLSCPRRGKGWEAPRAGTRSPPAILPPARALLGPCCRDTAILAPLPH